MSNNNIDILDSLQKSVIESQKKKESVPKYKFDKLKMYFGEDFNYKGIIISMPTIGDILKIGEERFFSSLSPFINNSTSIRVLLWDNGIDWCKVRDIEVYDILSKITPDKEGQSLLFKNFSFEKFSLVSIKGKTEGDNTFALYDKENNIALYEEDYMMIAEYIREILNMHPKVEKVKGRTTKSWIIQEDKMEIRNREEKGKDSTLLPLISSCINHPGFKYKLQELKDVGIYQFMDSVKRIQKYETGTAALKGCYSGFVDSSKIDKKVFDFMGDV